MKYASALLMFIVIFLTVSPRAQSGEEISDGNTLLPYCKAALDSIDNNTWEDRHQAFSLGFCLGLVEGVGFASVRVCPPKGVKVSQEMRVVVKYLESNPELLNFNEGLLVQAALSKAFPCPTK
jgi:hypothetical protein